MNFDGTVDLIKKNDKIHLSYFITSLRISTNGERYWLNSLDEIPRDNGSRVCPKIMYTMSAQWSVAIFRIPQSPEVIYH